ncbi:MAG: flagellar filament capping protein FliD [Desulfobacteraceae bacterium]|nr:flagellar filament capping protein FliD [Desulfobacteraceae bacterium]
MAGSISTLGLGSGLDLQDILDQLKDAERQTIVRKETQKEGLKEKVNAFNGLNAKLFAMKSSALSLSLESNFLKNSGAVSNEEILSARVDDGIKDASYSIEVAQKARQNSWQTAGVASPDAVIYAPPATTFASTGEAVTTADETMSIQYGAAGEQQTIDISLSAGMSLTQIADTVNNAANNKNENGEQLVSALINKDENGNHYIRMSAANGGNTADSQVSVSGFDYVKADITMAMGLADGSEPAYVSLAPGTTYEQAADLINTTASNPGISASIINDGGADTPWRLILVSDKTGEENRMTIQNLNLSEVTGAEEASLNAVFQVNGITYNRQTNTDIKDVISGVSLTLKKAGETSLGVRNDMDSAKENILSFVDNYNALIKEIRGTGSTDEADTQDTETTNPLEGDYNVKNLINKLSGLMSTIGNTESDYTSLVDLGLEINKDGTVTMDENRLDQAIATDPDAVQTLFIGDGQKDIPGLGDILNDGITTMTSSTGTVTTEIDATEERIERLEADITRDTERLNKRFDIMTQQFAQLDSFINQLNSEAAFMNSIFESFEKTTDK